MIKMLHRNLLNMLLALMLAVSNTVFVTAAAAADVDDNYGLSSSETMMIDGLLVRPVMLVGTVLGIVTFVGTLPFSILGGNVDEAGQKLVVEPAEYTFVRPLGEM
jgi:hypothetical protein